MNHVQKHPTILATKDQLFKTNLGNVEVLQIISQTKLLLTQKIFLRFRNRLTNNSLH